MSKPFTQYKSLYAAIYGYHPFNPDAGIFAGGYQGLLYPNPTTLHSPNTNFNPYLYQEPHPTPYTMKNTGDFYKGLGIGNPGINYRNAGHILGIFDTYNRMSYGLKIIKGIRSLSIANKFGTSVTINIPMLDGQTLAVIKTLSGSDIYPSFSEEPDDYIINFVNTDGLILDPRISEPFNFNEPYSPVVSPIDFNVLFTGYHVFSYRGMPEKFQDYFSQLINYAQTFPRIDQQKEVAFGSIAALTPIIDIPKHFPFEEGLSFLNTANVQFNFSNFEIPAHRFGSNFKVLDRTSALKSMTGNDVFHKNSETIYEYRSLTELNSVINIIPIQGYSFTFQGFTSNPSVIAPPPFPQVPVQDTFYITFSLVDVIINILNLSNRSVSLNGSVIMHYADGFASPPIFIDPDTEEIIISGPTEIQRRINFSTSMTNLFTWDRVWLGLDTFNDKSLEQFSSNYIISVMNQAIPDETFNISKDFNLNQGNNCIRARILAQSAGWVEEQNPLDRITTNLTIDVSNMAPIDYSFVIQGGDDFTIP